MAPKRTLEEDDNGSYQQKKPKTGFKVGPDNLPDGTWRRKATKIKNDLIHKAKIKKSYAKLKSREPVLDIPISANEDYSTTPRAEPASQEIHPERKSMLEQEDLEPDSIMHPRGYGPSRRKNKPGYFNKEQAYAEKQAIEAEARRLELEKNMKDREIKLKEREDYRRAMAKARAGDRNGQRKLGRESNILLERVKRSLNE